MPRSLARAEILPLFFLALCEYAPIPLYWLMGYVFYLCLGSTLYLFIYCNNVISRRELGEIVNGSE
jgi:hypothetical protein